MAEIIRVRNSEPARPEPCEGGREANSKRWIGVYVGEVLSSEILKSGSGRRLKPGTQ